MINTELDYKYTQAHYPNTVSWYREIVWLDGNAVGEICEPTDSTTRAKKYDVRKYVPLEVADGHVEVLETVDTFSRVCDAKEFINNGGIL